MAAGQGFKTFTTGEVLTAGDVNGYLMQGINVFADAAARDAAITAPAEGQFAYTKDNNSLWYYTGSAWAASGATGDIEGVTATSPLTGGGTSGTVTVGIQEASTSQRGSVQLSDSTSTTDSTLAATSTAVKSSYDLANAAIPKSTVTTAGDVIYATGSSAITRLGIGTAGQVLKVNSGATAPEWGASSSAAVGCLVFSPGTSFSYTSGAVTVIPMGSEIWDTDGFHSTSTNTSRITIPSGKAGKYQINGYIRTNTTAGNYAIINLLKNGSSYTGTGLEGGQMVRLSPNGNTYAMSGIAILDLAVGDYIELAYQADTSTGTYSMYSQFGVVYLGA